jgi:hypothetical protein
MFFLQTVTNISEEIDRELQIPFETSYKFVRVLPTQAGTQADIRDE